MEGTNLNVILDKKTDGYGAEMKNFIAPSEITVTITLGEYRELISEAAISGSKVSEANLAKYEAEKKVKELEAVIASLKSELYEASKKGENYGK